MKNTRSEYASNKYPNLYRYPNSPNWIFRKYCKEKRKEFVKSTGIADDQAKAYKIGLDRFNKWMGMRLHHSGRELLVRDIAKAVLAGKESKRDNTYRSSQNQMENHIIPAFGHLRPDQITALRWNLYDGEERRKGKRTKLFNTRKALIEIMNRAKEEGLIPSLPKLKNHDSEPRSGKYLDESLVQQIISAASPDTRLLIEIIYRMGSRPGEAIQYEYDMIRWDEDKFGRIYIPARITKTGRSRDIPLNSRISELLKDRQHEIGGQFIFPSPLYRDRPIKGYKTGWSTACRRAVCRSVCGQKCEKKCYDQPIKANIYDLRHTWVTNQAKRGVSVVFTAKYADTSIIMIQNIYAKAEPKAMQEVAG